MRESQYHEKNRTFAAERQPAFRRFFSRTGLKPDQKLWEAYLRWQRRACNEDFERFRQSYLAERMAMKTSLDAWPSPFVNARKGEPYKISFRLPGQVLRHKFFNLEELGLAEEADPADPCAWTISGIPVRPGKHTLRMFYVCEGWLCKGALMEKSFSLLVNPDPRELWEDIPSDQAMEYGRPDLAFARLACAGSMSWGASRRGRSHAHEGKPRDDAFLLARHNGWKMLAVSDGAGSAEFSRKGAELACEASVAECKKNLPENCELERIFQELDCLQAPATWKAAASKLAYHVLPAAAFAAHKAIRQEAEARGRESRAYAATLLLCLARKFPAGWAVLSFQIGDGAMGLKAGGKWELLAQPDEGEYGGQTRFVTMNEIFDSSHELMRRLRIDFVARLEGLLLMTDGVSDAWFQTGEGLNDSARWQELWEELACAAMGPEPEPALLDWLNFWSRGNHDDRTIAMLAAEQ
ncbi:MAG: protein phosphatase 2C domain-containing protein [Desulfovibrio sp.]|nr:protein phosphatase 2C domain-containing protein [Desulfovibrio sp.]